MGEAVRRDRRRAPNANRACDTSETTSEGMIDSLNAYAARRSYTCRLHPELRDAAKGRMKNSYSVLGGFRLCRPDSFFSVRRANPANDASTRFSRACRAVFR